MTYIHIANNARLGAELIQSQQQIKARSTIRSTELKFYLRLYLSSF